MKNIFFYLIYFISVLYMFNSSSSAKDIKKNIILSSYLKSINLVGATGQIIIKKDKFFFEINARALGIFSIISNWKQTIISEALFSNETLKSILYKSQDARGKKKGHMHVSYKDSIPNIISAQPNPKDDSRREKFNKNILKNTVDPVVGIFNLGLNGKCDTNAIIYDGKRKYALKSKFLKKEKIKRNNFFKNDFDAIKCVFDIVKLAGYTKKENKKYPENGYIWVKKMDNNLFFPVKFEVNSNWGNFICLIKEKEVNDESNNM